MIDHDALRKYVSRIMKIEEERRDLSEDIKEIYEQAKNAGFVTKHLRQLVKEQFMDKDELQEHLEQMDMMRHALGDFADSDLGKAALRKASDPSKPKRGPGRPRRDAGAPVTTVTEAFDRARAHLDVEEETEEQCLPLH